MTRAEGLASDSIDDVLEDRDGILWVVAEGEVHLYPLTAEQDFLPDLDGIPDEVDNCPSSPETFNGYQDEDGCPDPDNDGDGTDDVLYLETRGCQGKRMVKRVPVDASFNNYLSMIIRNDDDDNDNDHVRPAGLRLFL